MPQELRYSVTADSMLNISTKQVSFSEKDYAKLLEIYDLEYTKEEDYYLQVGEIKWTQGWIIDISVIAVQFSDLLNKVLPLLKQRNIAFKAVRNAKIARSMSGGELGYLLLGKLLSIYPTGDLQALELARELIGLTACFRGPHIPTDRHLGSVVYTRYGACNPVIRINEYGKEEKCVYNINGELVQDFYSIPFTLPKGVNWPYSTIASAKPPKLETVLQDKYKPMAFLKEDAKGFVRKGLFLEKWWHIKWCVIKEGKKNMIADDQGRDAADRLLWQFELHRNLKGVVPLPAIYDLFTENGNTYLVMEYIKGASLDNTIFSIFKYRVWNELTKTERLRLIDFANQVLGIIERMHVKGYIHRDITPVNFLVRSKDRLCMIDLELSYSGEFQKPLPPFRLGTPGFMSPEQEANNRPTVKEDIYSIGALLINILTFLSPSKFAIKSTDTLGEQLKFFISDKYLIDVVVQCFCTDPIARPTLFDIRKALDKFREEQPAEYPKLSAITVSISLDQQALKKTIQHALQALASRKMMNSAHLWVSKTIQLPGFEYQQSESVSVYPDLFQGLSGVLWSLTKAQKMRFSVHHCKEGIENSLTFIRKSTARRLSELPAGLYYGTAGMAVALIEGIENGLIPDGEDVREEIKSYLLKDNTQGIGIAKGVAGQGIALLRAIPLLGNTFVWPLLQQRIKQIIAQQQKDGSWITLSDKNKIPLKVTGFGYGIAGVILFLLEYCQRFSGEDTERIRQITTKAVEWLTRQVIRNDGKPIWYLHNKTKLYSTDLVDGIGGIVFNLIKAYEVLGEPGYRRLAEECLSNYLPFGISSDITLSTGLVGYAETCLEAALVFQSEEWRNRAYWVAQFLLHYFHEQKDGSRYWLPDGNIPTAGLMTGNSGIIHFLLRCYQPGILNHPLMIR